MKRSCTRSASNAMRLRIVECRGRIREKVEVVDVDVCMDNHIDEDYGL